MDWVVKIDYFFLPSQGLHCNCKVNLGLNNPVSRFYTADNGSQCLNRKHQHSFFDIYIHCFVHSIMVNLFDVYK